MAKNKKLKVEVEAGGLSDEQTKAKVKEANEANLPPELTEEEKEYARMTVKKEFNENFSKWANMPDEPADDAYIEQAKAEFQKCIDDTKNKKFLLATSERALESAKLLQELNNTKFEWKNGQWRGIILFNKIMNEKIEELSKDNTLPLEVDYSTLMHLYSAMTEPKGTGLKEAIKMSKYENYDVENDKPIEEDSPVTYSGLLEKINENILWLSNNDKKLNILKEKVNFAYAGIKMELKITELEEFLEFYDAINARAIDNDPDVKKLK